MADYDGVVFDILYQLFGKGEEIYERVGRLEEQAIEQDVDFRELAAKRAGLLPLRQTPRSWPAPWPSRKSEEP